MERIYLVDIIFQSRMAVYLPIIKSLIKNPIMSAIWCSQKTTAWLTRQKKKRRRWINTISSWDITC